MSRRSEVQAFGEKERIEMAFWSRWFGDNSRHSANAPTSARTLTIGEVVNSVAHELSTPPIQRCLLCEATATVERHESEHRISCAACGHYCVSLDAARALGALVQYRVPALAEMRKMLAAYRQSQPDQAPRIDVRYVVAAGVPTFFLPPD